MKKLFLFTCLSALAFSFNSCSDDDSKSSDSTSGAAISFKVNGVRKTFSNVIFEKFGSEGEAPYYFVEAIPTSNEPDELINFSFRANTLGSTVIEHFHYQTGSYDYYWGTGSANEFTHNFQANSTTKQKGTFSGIVREEDEFVTITEGSFNINQAVTERNSND